MFILIFYKMMFVILNVEFLLLHLLAMKINVKILNLCVQADLLMMLLNFIFDLIFFFNDLYLDL